MDKREAGLAGESFCANHYRKNGYEIIERNYHSKFGEIDVIAENETTLAMIEVKTRIENPMISGSESVDGSKQRKCMLTALAYLESHPSEKTIRFDVFEVIHNGKKLTKFRKTENAFEFDEKLLDKLFF